MKRALLVLFAVGTAQAQPAPDPNAPTPAPQAPAPQAPALPAPETPPADTPVPEDVVLAPLQVDRATCASLDTTPGALLEPAVASGELSTPIPWSEFVVDGPMIGSDSPAIVHALLEPTMQEHRTTLSNATWKEIAAITARFGYQLVGHLITDTPQGGRITLHLAPLPLIRKVTARVSLSGALFGLFDRLLDDEVRRRMRVRTGSYLPWDPIHRQCALFEERERITEFLYDEGYADAQVNIIPALYKESINLRIEVLLGGKYRTGKIEITAPPGGERLAVPDSDIKKLFDHCNFNLFFLCVGDAQFTRTRHSEDLQKVRELFQRRGYPSARVQSSFDPKTSFDRRTHTVNFTLTIDQRRPIDIRFDGNFDHGELPDEELRKQLTFDAVGSADDVEAASSAKALAAYMQGRGYFDARVFVERQRLAILDKYVFHLETGPQREVAIVEFVGNHLFSSNFLHGLVATKEAGLSGSLLGTNTAATSAQLGLDVVRIQEAYRKAGYRETTVARAAATDPIGLDSTALTAALVLAEIGHDLIVRYTIDEGQPTLLTRVAVDIQASTKQRSDQLCEQMLAELATELREPQFAKRDTTMGEGCYATAANLKFREDDAATTRDRLRDFLYRSGRPRSTVEYETKELGPHRMTANYKVRAVDDLRIGKVIVRGAFHTRSSVIYGELRLHEGDLLTTDSLADGARRLRNTGLFNAVNIDLPDLCANQTNTAATCASSSLVVNAVVRVEERYDFTAQIDLVGGYSSYNGAFVGGTYAMRNILGLGLVWTLTGTYGTKITDVESTFLVPQWLVRRVSPVEFRTELTGLYRQQDTPRFGQLVTEGASLALSRQWQRQHVGTVAGRAITAGLHYDFRLRTREVDVLRPIGVNQDSSQVAIGTRTGSIGLLLDWDQRTDRSGALAPLSPEAGFHVEASAAYASPYLFGQDTFIKLSATASKFIPIGDNLVLRGDFRYDQGIPLGGAVLLPEVERFFAGGDSTVRGYSDDRMATELIQVGVPPVGNLTQIRVIPAGGNIRMLGSVDGQVRIWKILAGAMFADAGLITNEWSSVTLEDVRPSVGVGLRALTPFGTGALEYAIPLRPKLGDDPRGRLHFYFAARAQF